MKQIVVIGSINMDIVNQVERHPLPGETIMGLNTAFNSGGKGGNQAVAAARGGGQVSMIGAVGDDLFGGQLISSLATNHITTEHIFQKKCRTGLAFITVNAEGENSIILEKGANGELTMEDLSSILNSLMEKDILLLLQNEIPWKTTEYIINEAYKRSVPVYLNLAPAKKIKDSLLAKLNGLFVNETEAEVLTGVAVEDRETAEEAAVNVLKTGLKEIVVTLGEKGSYFADYTGASIFTPALQVKAIDTTAAGDTFIGAYIVSRCMEHEVEYSLHFATAASAFTVMNEGAQKSIPNMDQIEKVLNQSPIAK